MSRRKSHYLRAIFASYWVAWRETLWGDAARSDGYIVPCTHVCKGRSSVCRIERIFCHARGNASQRDSKYSTLAGVHDPCTLLAVRVVFGRPGAQDMRSLFANMHRYVPLPVSGGFHSALMNAASVKFSEILDDCDIKDAQIPVFTNVDAEPTTSAIRFKSKI